MAAPRRLGRGSLEAQSRGARATKRGLRAPCRVARRAVSAREGRGARGSGPLDVLYEAAEMGALDAETGAALADVLGAGVGERAVQAQEGAQLGAQGAAQAGEEAQTRCQSFHLAVPCSDVEEARRFYGPGGALGLAEGRRSARWQDYDLYGHQLVLHQVDGYDARGLQSAVDGDPVPVPHFGCALSVPEFHALAARVVAAGVDFEVSPHVRFRGQRGEQWAMFFRDPSGNALEFKAMADPAMLFARYDVDGE